MPAGKLTERVRFEREQRTSDGGGGSTLSWIAVAVRWAMVEPLKGREQLEAMKVEASNLYRVTLRNDFVVDPSWRLVWITGGGLVLNIREAPTTPRAELYRHLVAEAGVAQ